MQNSVIRIAVLLTCFNRCEKTLVCLKSLINAITHYNKFPNPSLYLELFITNDGCTDNTFVEIEKEIKPVMPVTVIEGNGNLFWAGGMRFAWKKALEYNWDYFLLLNDDTELKLNVFDELFNAVDYCKANFNKEGLYSGITCAPSEINTVTYGGFKWRNRAKATIDLVQNSGKVQECDMANANILLVHNSVVESIGIFYDKYVHANADFDYSIVAKRNGFPVVVTANICGECPYDHLSKVEYLKQICNMTLAERKKHFSNPLYSNKDFEVFRKRTTPSRVWIVKIGRWINLYMPKLYLWLHLIREY